MKRFYSTYRVNHSDGFTSTNIKGDMKEDPDGDWVRYEDVEKLEEENNHLKGLNRELVLRNELFAQALFPRDTLVAIEGRGKGE